MRKFLKSLPIETVLSIGMDLGSPNATWHGCVEYIVESAKAYRWTVEDLKARYHLSECIK